MNSYYASLAKIASAEAALGAPIALEDSLVLKQLVVALGNVTTGGGGSGDVVGPASAVDGQIAMFDGITGKLLKTSGVKALSNALELPGAVSGTSTIQAPPVAGSAVVTLPSITGTLAIIGNTVSQFAAGGTLSSLTGFSLRSTGAAFDLSLATDEVLSADRTLKFNVGNADRTLTIPATGTAALLGTANVFTGIQTITPAVNAKSLIVTGVTHTADSPIFDLAQTWNNAGVTFNALKLNVTNTASAAASLLIDLQVGGSSRFKVAASTGHITSFGGFFGAGSIDIQSTWGVNGSTGNQVMYFSGTFGWAAGNGGFSATADALFARKAAATIQMGADAAGVTNQMFTAASRITSDGVGANLTIAGGNGRGGAGGTLILATYDTAGAATIGTLRSRMTFDTAGSIAFPVVTAVTTETVVSDTTWPVTINGTAYKILLKA